MTAPPTLVFDGAILAAGPPTGVAGSFLTTLREYAGRTAARCILLVPDGVEPPELPGVEARPGPAGRVARQRMLPRLLREIGADLLHCPVAAVPLRASCPVIATVHDLPWMAPVPLDEPGCGPLHRLAVRIAARRADAIVVPSRATADDLVRYVGPAAAARVRQIPHGIPAPPAPAPAAQLDGPFLVLGDARPRKNLDAVRQAHERARRGAPELPPLLLVGPGFGYVEEHRKLQLLRSARALLHVALHEGFGLPVVEAFAHGVPVLAADIACLREVADGAACLVTPLDVDAIATAMVRMHRDTELRHELRTRGLRRAAVLTPAASAAGWDALHSRLLRGRVAAAVPNTHTS